MTQLTLKDNGTKKMKQRSIAMSLYVTYVCKTIPRYMTDHHQGPFCTPHSICLNISFWQSSFVWKCCIKRSKYWNEIRRTSALSVIFKMKTLRKIAFLCQDKNQLQSNSAEMPKSINQTLLKCQKKQPFISVYLPNHIFQTSVLFNYVKIKFIEINRLCKHRKKVRNSQASISIK